MLYFNKLTFIILKFIINLLLVSYYVLLIPAFENSNGTKSYLK